MGRGEEMSDNEEEQQRTGLAWVILPSSDYEEPDSFFFGPGLGLSKKELSLCSELPIVGWILGPTRKQVEDLYCD